MRGVTPTDATYYPLISKVYLPESEEKQVSSKESKDRYEDSKKPAEKYLKKKCVLF